MAALTNDQAKRLASRIVGVDNRFAGKEAPKNLIDFLINFEKNYQYDICSFAAVVAPDDEYRYSLFIFQASEFLKLANNDLTFDSKNAEKFGHYFASSFCERDKTSQSISLSMNMADKIKKDIDLEQGSNKWLSDFDIEQALNKYFIGKTLNNISITKPIHIEDADIKNKLPSKNGHTAYIPINIGGSLEKGGYHWVFVKAIKNDDGELRITVYNSTAYFTSKASEEIQKREYANKFGIQPAQVTINVPSEADRQTDGWSCGYRTIQGIVREINNDLPAEEKLGEDAQALIAAKDAEDIKDCVLATLAGKVEYEEYKKKQKNNKNSLGAQLSTPSDSSEESLGNMRELDKWFDDDGNLNRDNTYFLKKGSKAEDVEGGHRKYTLQLREKKGSDHPGGKLICQTNGNKYNLEKWDSLTEFDIEALAEAAKKVGYHTLRLDKCRSPQEAILIISILEKHKIELDLSGLSEEFIEKMNRTREGMEKEEKDNKEDEGKNEAVIDGLRKLFNKP